VLFELYIVMIRMIIACKLCSKFFVLCRFNHNSVTSFSLGFLFSFHVVVVTVVVVFV
jgi:hypothetical protein